MTPQEKVDAATARFLSGLVVHPEDGNHSRSPTGEEYIVITVGGPKAEGESCMAFATNPDKAIALWRREMAVYAASAIDSKSVLYWRNRPEIESCIYVPKASPRPRVIGLEVELWQIYSRLLISSKPVTQSTRTRAA